MATDENCISTTGGRELNGEEEEGEDNRGQECERRRRACRAAHTCCAIDCGHQSGNPRRKARRVIPASAEVRKRRQPRERGPAAAGGRDFRQAAQLLLRE